VPDAFNQYQFGRRTADFLLCRNCGVYLGAVMRSKRGSFGIINVRVLHSLLDRLQEPERMYYENEGLAERQERRESRWTPIAVG
jgi:hypothetical protein